MREIAELIDNYIYLADSFLYLLFLNICIRYCYLFNRGTTDYCYQYQLSEIAIQVR